MSSLLVFIIGIFCARSLIAGLLPFPLTANQRGTVSCMESFAVKYDAYLPPAYSPTNPPLPIVYTFHPNGGGMVGYFQSVCSSMNIILIGITGSSNGASWDVVMREMYAVTRDIRRRVLFDPTAEMAAGFSGGGECCYVFARARAQHCAGIMPMAGWLGRPDTNYYPTTDRVQTNLFVARITGDSDSGALYFLAPDSNYLASCGAIIQDWYFAGGHDISSPDSLKVNGFNWILSQRIPPNPGDQTNSAALEANWRSRIAIGQQESVLRECMNVVMTQPRTWNALRAELVMDDLLSAFTTMRTLNVDNLAQGDFASDLLYYIARGSANGAVPTRYRGTMKAMTGVTGASGDRAGDIRALLQQYGYFAPILECSGDAVPGRVNLRIHKDTPGLEYHLQSRTNFTDDVWQELSYPTVETESLWSLGIDSGPGDLGFFQMRVTPAVGTSPPWPY